LAVTRLPATSTVWGSIRTARPSITWTLDFTSRST
jgi:hypothetical protein